MKIVFSPCLYCTSQELYDLHLLESILDFITNYLDGSLDEYEGAFYMEERLSNPPFSVYNAYSSYSNIIKMLRDLKMNGEYHQLQGNINYSITNTEYRQINPDELQIVSNYINHIDVNDLIMFLGEKNWDINCNSLSFIFNNVTTKQVNIITNPWLDKSGNYDSYIKYDLEKDFVIFANRKLCKQLDESMKKEVSLSDRNGSLYKKYGKIIAYRNNFKSYYPKNPYDSKTDYYIRKDGKYIISVDLLHGHFEVFYGNGKQLWFAEYNFSGEELYAPTGKKELNEMRKNHKVEA